jgi:hypothetical protein
MVADSAITPEEALVSKYAEGHCACHVECTPSMVSANVRGSGANLQHLRIRWIEPWPPNSRSSPLLAVERMETAIDRALGGHDPDNRIWGPLSASEFLIVVQDVTTWSLSNFECFCARPEAENLPTGVRIVADFYFTMVPGHLPPFASGFSLRKTPEPGLRAAALWMAAALLAKQEAYTRVETVEPPARQWRLLKRRTPTGLYWLFQQMAAWPRRYTRHQWMDLNSILVLYR